MVIPSTGRFNSPQFGGTGTASTGENEAEHRHRLNSGVILENLRNAVGYAQRARGKNIVALIGQTGTGKSTIINQLMGKNLVRIRFNDETCYDVDDGQPIAEIGHGRPSKTDFAKTYPIDEFSAYVDCGGFLDNRGVQREVVVVASTKLTIEAANSAKLAFCCTWDNIASRANNLTSLISEVFSNVLDEQASNSIMVVVTCAYRRFLDDPFPTTEMARRKFATHLAAEGEESDLGRIYKFILRDNGKYILLYDPENPECRRDFEATVATLDPMSNTCLQPAYSAQAVQAIYNDIISIAVQGTHLLKNHSLKQKAITACEAHLSQLGERCARFQALIAGLGQNDIDPNLIREQNETSIDDARHGIDQLTIKIEHKSNRKTTIEQQIRDIGAHDEEEVVIYDPGVFQRGAHIESYEVQRTKKKKKRFVGIKVGSKRVRATPRTEYLKLPIEHAFFFQGEHPILRIEMNPSETAACWSESRGGVGENYHSVKYKTEPGEPADASVKIFGKRKHLASVIQEKAQKHNELLRIATKVNQLNHLVQERENEIHRAEIENISIDNDLNNLEFYHNQLHEVENHMREHEAEKNRLEREKTELREQLLERTDPEFQFLMEYKELSRDRRLENEGIEKFIRKYQVFQESNRR